MRGSAGRHSVGLVDETARIDELDSIQSAATDIALITARVLCVRGTSEVIEQHYETYSRLRHSEDMSLRRSDLQGI